MNSRKIILKISAPEASRNIKWGPEGTHQGCRHPGGAAYGGSVPRGRLGSLVAPWLPLPPIFRPRHGNPWERALFPDPFSFSPPPPFQDRGCQRRCLGTL